MKFLTLKLLEELSKHLHSFFRATKLQQLFDRIFSSFLFTWLLHLDLSHYLSLRVSLVLIRMHGRCELWRLMLLGLLLEVDSNLSRSNFLDFRWLSLVASEVPGDLSSFRRVSLIKLIASSFLALTNHVEILFVIQWVYAQRGSRVQPLVHS
jgi:hypothetical protein